MTLTPDGDQVRVGPRDFPVNRGGLCQRGWTSADLLASSSRLETPLIRRDGELIPATWDEALDLAVTSFRRIQARNGADAVGVFGGGGLTNEKAYWLGKFARVVPRSSSIDYNGRFCMSSAAAAGARAFGVDRGLPFPLADVGSADVLLLADSNAAETTPPFTRWLSDQQARGGGLIVIDPRETPTARRATLHLLRAGGVRAGGAAGQRGPGQEPARPAQTDKLDAQWLARLTEMGLLRASFVPPKEIRDLRDYTRARTRLIQERTRCWQRMEKLLEGALVKLSSMASKLTTLSAQDMIKAMITGQRDPRVLASLTRGRMKARHDDLAEALDGMFDDHHGELAGLLMTQIAFLDEQITQLTTQATRSAAALPAAWGVNADGTTGPDAGTTPGAPALNAVVRLAQIPGVSEDLARSIIAETGLDMSRFARIVGSRELVKGIVTHAV